LLILILLFCIGKVLASSQWSVDLGLTSGETCIRAVKLMRQHVKELIAILKNNSTKILT